MNLNKYKLISNKEKKKFIFHNIHPFSCFEVTKIKNEFLKELLKYRDKEKNYISLFGIKSLNNSKNEKRKRSSKMIQKSFSSTSLLSNLNDLLSLNIHKKNSEISINRNNNNFQILPEIKRNLRRYKTNLSINTNNINNYILKNFLENNQIKNRQIKSSKKTPFITDLKEIKQINMASKKERNKISTNLTITESLNENQENDKQKKEKNLNFNNHFSFNKMSPISIKSQISLHFESPISFPDKKELNKLSNRSILDIKSISILNNPINNRNKPSSFYQNFEKNLISKNINDFKDNKRKNSLSSLQSQNSSDIKSIDDNNQMTDIKNGKKVFNKKRKKIFNLIFKEKIFDLQKEINNNSNAHEKSKYSYNSYIKYMIKKSKFIYNILDNHLTYKVPKKEYNIKKNELPEFIQTIIKENLDKQKVAEIRAMRNKIDKNELKITRLINENQYINRRVNYHLNKYLRNSNFTS